MSAIAKLIVDGQSKVVLLPGACQFEGSEVRIAKFGDKVVRAPRAKPFQLDVLHG